MPFDIKYNPELPYSGLRSPLQMFYHWEEKCPDNTFMLQPFDGKWLSLTWKEAAQQVRLMTTYLRSLDLPPGSRIAILSKNCNYWLLTDFAIMMSGHVSVPLYPNLTAASIRQILEHSESRVCFVGKLDNFESMRGGIPKSVDCITFPIYAQSGYPRWDELVKDLSPADDNPQQNLDDLMTIIYTSGTTGTPKGVMHKVRNFSFAVTYALKIFSDLRQGSKFFSYLPLSHIAERVVVEFASLYAGGCVYFAESIDVFAKNLQYTQPSVFLAVPRIWTKFQMAILDKMPQWKLDLLLKIPVLNTVIKNKIRKGLGLSEAKYVLVGAAPMPPSLLEWYKKLGIVIQEGYAMTENTAYSHFTLPGKIKFGTVGQALPHNDIRIAEDGEILSKSPAVFNGYYKNEELTHESLTADGYLRTGDKGQVDAEGYLSITGRVKEIFKTMKGKYVAPSPIEMRMLENTIIEQICVTGASLPQPIALVVLSQTAKELPKEEIENQLKHTLHSVNPTLDQHERMKCLIVMADEWSVENDLLTPTLKMKRNVIDDRYQSRFQQWFDMEKEVFFEC